MTASGGAEEGEGDTGRERRILEERGAEYAEELEEKAVIVATARRVDGGKLQPTSHDYTIKSRVQNEREG